MNFATADDVAEAWRPLSAAEAVNAEMLLTAAAQWIRRQVPGIADDDASARFVSIDVTKSALIPGAHAGYSAFSKGIGPWSKSGTLLNPAGALEFQGWHKEMLGIATGPVPVGWFGDRP